LIFSGYAQIQGRSPIDSNRIRRWGRAATAQQTAEPRKPKRKAEFDFLEHLKVNAMKKDRSRTSSRNRFARSEWLKLALAAWLFAVSLTALSNTSSGVSSARSGAAPSAPLASIVVNTTGDGDNIDASAGCDADAATPGEQCTLRAAIQRANTAAGDDTITFNIPATEPNCDAGTGACTINLTKALPDLNTNVAINGPGVDKLTVRRGSGGQLPRFHWALSRPITDILGFDH